MGTPTRPWIGGTLGGPFVLLICAWPPRDASKRPPTALVGDLHKAGMGSSLVVSSWGNPSALPRRRRKMPHCAVSLGLASVLLSALLALPYCRAVPAAERTRGVPPRRSSQSDIGGMGPAMPPLRDGRHLRSALIAGIHHLCRAWAPLVIHLLRHLRRGVALAMEVFVKAPQLVHLLPSVASHRWMACWGLAMRHCQDLGCIPHPHQPSGPDTTR